MTSAVMTWWWLSFSDPSRPEGDQFLGAAVVGPAATFMHAVVRAHRLGVNPGGEALGGQIPEEGLSAVPESWRNRLLSRADVEELDREVGGAGVERVDQESAARLVGDDNRTLEAMIRLVGKARQ